MKINNKMKSLIKLSLLSLTTLTLFACGSSGGSDAPAPTATPAPVITKLTIANTQAGEGENIIFTVTATPNIAKAISFNYRINFDDPITSTSANANDLSGDFSGTKTSTIAANSNSTTISIPIVNDTFKEKAETFTITLSNLAPTTDATFTNNKAIGTIESSDPDKVKTILSIVDSQAGEGENITFTVTSAFAIAEQISFDYRIDFDNPITSTSAQANDLSGDFSGTKTSTIAANSNSTTISIPIVNDTFKEKAETFTITLSHLAPTTDATFTNIIAIGTIESSDPDKVKTILSIANAEAGEGSMLIFTVTSAFAIAEQISFQYEATLDNTTTAGEADLSGQLTGTSTIDINKTSTTISIATVNDSLREEAESFSVILSDLSPTDATFAVDNIGRGTIIDNDATGIVIISVADAEANEDSGTINFQVTSNFNHSQDVTFDYEVVLDNSANANDFDTTTGTATISAANSSTMIAISIATDGTLEPNETFSLMLTNTSANATIDSANNSATGKILNDDVSNVSNATAMLGETSITLNWTNPDSNLFAGVTIAQRTGSTAPAAKCTADVVATTDSQTTSRSITGLTTGTGYSFRICAISTSGSISSGAPLANLTPSVIIDNNNNGLIDIADATALSNIRHNLDGTGYKASSDAPSFTRGCPNNKCIGYELTANIDLSSFNGGTWDPIGSNSDNDRFTAIFDGTDNRISNLRITSGNYIGLFSSIQNATIKNLKLATVDIDGGRNVGALAGLATGSNTLSKIELIGGEITGTGINVGGLVGRFSGTINDASSSLTITSSLTNTNGDVYTGGLVGSIIQAGSSIKNSNSSGSVSTSGGANIVGGLVGLNRGSISNSWASGRVSSNGGDNNNDYGGLVGSNQGNISNSWARGDLSNTTGIVSLNYGGLVGINEGNISNSWASGNISGASIQNGGLVGQNHSGTISNSWASGNITATANGGLLGFNDEGSIMGRNYQLDNDQGSGVNLANNTGIGHSFILGGTGGNRATKLMALEMLSGATNDATSDYGTHSSWHAGFNITMRVNGVDVVNVARSLFTRFCDTNGNGMIDLGNVVGNPDERTANNSVWVMAPNDVTTASTDIAGGGQQGYYQIPALRCIGDTKGKTTQEINAIRQREIDRQRRLFAK